MRAAWYERGGPAGEVLTVGEMEDPRPEAGEVLVRVYASGVNPGEVKKRSDWMGYGIGYPRVIPHSDGAGTIEEVGEGGPSARPLSTSPCRTNRLSPCPPGSASKWGRAWVSRRARPTAASSPRGPSRERRCSSPAERGRWAASPSRSRSGEGRR